MKKKMSGRTTYLDEKINQMWSLPAFFFSVGLPWNFRQMFYCFKSDDWNFVLHQYVYSCTKRKLCMLWGFVYKRSKSFLIDFFFCWQEGEAGKENPDVKPSQSGGFINDPKVRYMEIFSPSQGLFFWNCCHFHQRSTSLKYFPHRSQARVVILKFLKLL